MLGVRGAIDGRDLMARRGRSAISNSSCKSEYLECELRDMESRVRSARERVWRGFLGDGDEAEMDVRIWAARSGEVGAAAVVGTAIGASLIGGESLGGGGVMGGTWGGEESLAGGVEAGLGVTLTLIGSVNLGTGGRLALMAIGASMSSGSTGAC